MTRVSRRGEDFRLGAAGAETRRAELSEAGRAESLGERRLGFLDVVFGLGECFLGMGIGYQGGGDWSTQNAARRAPMKEHGECRVRRRVPGFLSA